MAGRWEKKQKRVFISKGKKAGKDTRLEAVRTRKEIWLRKSFGNVKKN